MKVSLNSQFLSGPYGGGMQFANFLRDFLTQKGIRVVNDLKDADIDIILHINPFPFLTRQASAYSYLEAYAYKFLHPKTIIIERVNECDERKGTKYMNRLLINAGKHSDAIVYIASWLRPLLEKRGMPKNKPAKVILNGADLKIFNRANKAVWPGSGKLKIVTHHWSKHPNKGHAIYKQLDELLAKPEFADKFEFTYIGEYPKEIQYKNTKRIPALSGVELAAELKKHHIYITATLNEPGGMHHVEGALCGLPLLYINSGSLPEYCSDFGLEFTNETLAEKLLEIRQRYTEFARKIEAYGNTAEKMGQEYLEFMRSLYDDKEKYTFSNSQPLKALCILGYNRLQDMYWSIKRKLKII